MSSVERALALFGACSAEFAARNPLPEIAGWSDIADARERLRRALGALYDYYERTEAMLSHVLRDAENMPALRQVGAPRRRWLARVEERLAQDWDGNASQARHAIALAIDFRTWPHMTDRPIERAAMPKAVIDEVGQDHRLR